MSLLPRNNFSNFSNSNSSNTFISDILFPWKDNSFNLLKRKSFNILIFDILLLPKNNFSN